MFRQFLRDVGDDLRKGMLEQWESGEIVLATEQEARGRLAAVTEMADIEFGEIVKFYEETARLDGGQSEEDT